VNREALAVGAAPTCAHRGVEAEAGCLGGMWCVHASCLQLLRRVSAGPGCSCRAPRPPPAGAASETKRCHHSGRSGAVRRVTPGGDGSHQGVPVCRTTSDQRCGLDLWESEGRRQRGHEGCALKRSTAERRRCCVRGSRRSRPQLLSGQGVICCCGCMRHTAAS
jgi:hypothetical protein